MAEGQRKRGGQPKPPAERKRNSLTFRAKDDLRHRLEAEAAKSDRPLSEEIETRLEDSLKWNDLFGSLDQMVADIRRRARDDAEMELRENLKTETAKLLRSQGWKMRPVPGLPVSFWLDQEAQAFAVSDESVKKALEGDSSALIHALRTALRETLKPELLQPEKGASDAGQHHKAGKK